MTNEIALPKVDWQKVKEILSMVKMGLQFLADQVSAGILKDILMSIIDLLGLLIQAMPQG